MRTRARIAGHPIHPMLIAFPVAFYVATVVTLLAHVGTGDVFWYRVAMWSNIAGVVMAAVAAIPGLIDLLSLPRRSRARATGHRHAAFNSLALVLFVISAVILYRNYSNVAGAEEVAAGTLNVAAPLTLSILGVLSTLAAGWLGWNLVQTHHVGVLPGRITGAEQEEEEAARERGEGREREPRMPETYQETYRTTIRH